MALSSNTFSLGGGAVSDLFAGFSARDKANMRAEGLNLNASGLRIKAQGDLAEATNYDRAAGLARENEQYIVQSQRIQQLQLDRQIAGSIGGQQADVAGAGLKQSGSALDLLRDSASQGALAKDVLARQGAIQEQGYEEQAQSYETMAAAGRMAYSGELGIADRTDVLAQETRDAGKTEATADFASAAIKGAAAVATLFI